MSPNHRLLLIISSGILLAEFTLVIVNLDAIVNWLSHNLWIVVIPFTKLLFKKLLGMKFWSLLKGALILGWHFSKLLLLKLLKVLTVRYGVFFSQRRWYWMRLAKVMYLRRGKQFFRAVTKFWSIYQRNHKWIIMLAFFPVGLLLFFLGLSFTVTRKTMVRKTQETAVFKMAASAGVRTAGISAWISRLDEITLEKIRSITRRNRMVGNQIEDQIEGQASDQNPSPR